MFFLLVIKCVVWLIGHLFYTVCKQSFRNSSSNGGNLNFLELKVIPFSIFCCCCARCAVTRDFMQRVSFKGPYLLHACRLLIQASCTTYFVSESTRSVLQEQHKTIFIFLLFPEMCNFVLSLFDIKTGNNCSL